MIANQMLFFTFAFSCNFYAKVLMLLMMDRQARNSAFDTEYNIKTVFDKFNIRNEKNTVNLNVAPPRAGFISIKSSRMP